MHAILRLRRIYILFNANHGLNNYDLGMLQHLSELMLDDNGSQRFSLQAVLTKVDLVPVDKLAIVREKMTTDIFKAAPLCLSPIITSSDMSPPFGIDALRRNIDAACEQ